MPSIDPREPVQRRRADAAFCLLLGLFISVVYWPELTFQRSFFFFDVSAMNLPARRWGFEQIREGSFPLWCRNLETGFPFVAESQTGICYPPNYATYTFMEAWRAYSINLLAHLWFAGVGAYLLFRRSAGCWGSVVGSTMFMLGGRLLAHQIHTARVDLFAWFPWVLWAFDHFAASGRFRWLAAAAFGIGMQALAGALQEVLICSVGYLAYIGAHARLSPANSLKLLLSLAIAAMLGLCIGAALILPAGELLAQSVRAGGMNREMANWGAATPYVWIAGSFPSLFGSLGMDTAWLEGPTPWREMDFYHGFWLLPLAAAGLSHGDRKSVWKFLVIASVGFLLAQGELNLIGQGLAKLPLFGGVRIPVRFLVVAGVGLCGLAALGVDALADLSRRKIALRWVAIAFGLLMVLASGATVVAYGDLLGLRSGDDQTAAIVGSPFWSRLTNEWRSDALWLLGIALSGTTALILASRKPRIAGVLLLAVVVVDVGRHARGFFPTIEPSFHDEPGSVRFLKEHSHYPRVQIYDGPTTISQAGFQLSTTPYRELGECLYYERGPMFDVSLISISPGLPLTLQRQLEFLHRLGDRPEYFRLTGIEWVMTSRPLRGQGIEERPAYEGKNCYVYRVIDPAPMAYFCPRAVAAASGKSLEILASSTTDPRERVVLEEDEIASIATNRNIVSWKPASFQWDGPNRIRCSVAEAPSDGWLVVQESWYPGWFATVNGRDAPVLRANDLFMAVPIPRGASEIALTFQSRSLAVGLATSAGAILLCGILFVWNGRWKMDSPTKDRRWDVGALLAFVVLTTALSIGVDPCAWSATFHQASSLP